MNELRRTAMVGEQIELREQTVQLTPDDGLVATDVILHTEPKTAHGTWTAHYKGTGGAWATQRNVTMQVLAGGIKRARTTRMTSCEACGHVGAMLLVEAWAVFKPQSDAVDVVLVDPRQMARERDA